MEGESALEDKFLGVSRHDAKVRRLIMYAAFSPDPVLILGETGSGKEVAARLIHQSNPDMLPRPMKSLNCAGLPHDLFESELFGYVKGAFTGAIRDKMGLWEAAGHGTLFLDEIGDMPLSQQAKVLRALREKTIRRLGDTKDRPVHARIIAATNRDIPAMIAAGQFRQDLYYRLRGFLIRTPALRAHPENIPHLARRLWRQDDHDHLEPLSPEVLESLQRYGWPGNVGELQRFLRALHSHFPKVKHLDGRHVATLARLLGMGEGSLARPAQPSSKEDMDLHRARCLGHLKHAEDALVALRLTTDKILEAASLGAPLERPRQELARNAAELAALCEPAERIYFHGEHARDLVCALCEKVFGFSCGLAGESTASLAAWAATAGPQLDKAATVVMREIGAVLKQG